MNVPETEHIIAELKDNLKKKDMIKARLILLHITDVDVKTRRRMLYELHREENEFVIRLLNRVLTEAPDLAGASPEIRQLLFSKIIEKPDCMKDLLQSSSPSELQNLVEISGEMRLEELVPHLMKILADATHDDVIQSIIAAMGAIGDPLATNAVSEFLYSGKRELVITAIRALSLIASPTAVERLAERMGTDNELDIMILDAFADIQDSLSLEKLNRAIKSYHAHLRNYAKQKMIQVGAKAVPALTDNLHHDDPDLLIHSLNVLGDIGDVSAVPMIRKLLHQQPANANVRFAAYEALGRLPLTKGMFTLAVGLSDAVEHVRIAAAKAIDKNYNDILAAGVRNLFNSADNESLQIVQTIVTAQAEKLFVNLLDLPRFREQVSHYLIHQAHKDVRSFFADLLYRHGYRQEALQIQSELHRGVASSRPTICVVDDSRMILNIYKNTLHNLNYESMLFEFPAGALDWLAHNQPDLLITDLNMPEINGIELTTRVRSMYSADILPVIMITTQNDLQDLEAARRAGVSRVVFKPFTADSLGEAIGAFVQRTS